MKNLKFFIPIIFMAILFQNCKKETVKLEGNIDYFVFSLYHCECAGDCSSVYKIEDEQLFEGQDPSCIVDDFGFDDVTLSQDKLTLAKELFDLFPDELLDRNGETFGCPDCGDWGGHIVAIKKDGVEYTWNIDRANFGIGGNPALPTWLLPFTEKMDEVIEQIR